MSVEVAVNLPDNIDQLVDQYVRLRDKLKEADDAHKKKTEPARTYLMMLNGKLLEQLAAVGGDSVKTPHGTVYQTTKRTASIADGDVFREYVITNEQFDLVEPGLVERFEIFRRKLVARLDPDAAGAFVDQVAR